MADRKRAELAAAVDEIVEAVTEVGFAGVMEGPSPLKTMVELHKLNDSTNLSKLLSALDETATRTMSARNVSFPELVVASQLLLDIEGPAAAPEDSPLESEVTALATHLRLVVATALSQFARPGSEEARQGLQMACGLLLMLHDKVQGDALLTLAVEHALLRLLFRSRPCVLLLRDRSWALAALSKQVEALKDFKAEDGEPLEGLGAAGEEGGEGDEEAGGEEEEAEEEEMEDGDEEADGEAEEDGEEDG